MGDEGKWRDGDLSRSSSPFARIRRARWEGKEKSREGSGGDDRILGQIGSKTRN